MVEGGKVMNKDYYDGAKAAIQVFRESSIEYPIVGRIADLVAAAFEAPVS